MPVSAAGPAVSVEPAPAVDQQPTAPAARGALHIAASPLDSEASFGVEDSVTAGIAIMAPRAVPSTVSVALEFGRAGHGWAGAIVFNLWLRRQLRERRMSQRQLAALSGVDHSTISRLLKHEGRSPSLATATLLARALRQATSDEDASAYFARLPDATIFPTARVEMALRGDEDLDDDDVRSVMEAYLIARAQRRKARQSSSIQNGSSPPPPLVSGSDSPVVPRTARRAR